MWCSKPQRTCSVAMFVRCGSAPLVRSQISRLVSVLCHSTTSTAKSSRVRVVLGIESSCDDTGAAIVTSDGKILGEALATQEEIHRPWGGVVPMLAKEAHEAAIHSVVAEALRNADMSEKDLDAVAVTIGPGLSLCLGVGVTKARQLSAVHQLKLINCHHMEAHALVARMGNEHNVQFPFICLLVSGGHNLLLLVRGVGDYLQIGTTLDDAIGEAFDKVARMLGLELFPSGGAVLESFAKEGDPDAFDFTVPLRHQKTCNFSFSGLKTNVRLAVQAHIGEDLSEATRQVRADIAASFQRVAVLHIAVRVARAFEWAEEVEPGVKTLVVAGGVASNQAIRETLTTCASKAGVQAVYPPVRLCTDNGVMVAWAGMERLKLGIWDEPTEYTEDEWVELKPRWPLTDDKHPRLTIKNMKSRRRVTPKPQAESLTTLTRGLDVHPLSL